jgi:HAD superfamily hydrolase (TIGR01509 family)
MQLEAVLFDLDGLMVDSEPHSIAAWREVLARRGAVLDQPTLDHMLGQRLTDTARMLAAKLRLAETPEALAREKTDWQIANLRGNVQPMPGLYRLLEAIDGRGLQKAIATSGVRAYLDAVLEAIGLAGRFAILVTGEDVARGKPAPDVFLEAARRLEINPDRCLVLEDAPHGAAAARAAGMACIVVPNEQTRRLQFPAGTRKASSLEEIAIALGSGSGV